MTQSAIQSGLLKLFDLNVLRILLYRRLLGLVCFGLQKKRGRGSEYRILEDRPGNASNR